MRHGWGILLSGRCIYEGAFSLNRKMGKGLMIYAGGSTYYGDFTNDKPHGQGLLKRKG
jgi:hypothetical protein